MRSLAGYLLAVAAIVGFTLARLRPGGAAQPPSGDSPEEGRSVAAEPAAAASQERGWLGVLMARRYVDVSPRVGSLVRTVAVRAGDSVKKDATLATLDARDRAGALRVAQVAEEDQRRKAARSARMRAASLVSDEEADVAQAEARRRAAETDLARLLVDDATVRAPFDGIIVERFVEPGMYVAGGTSMFRLIDSSGGRLRFGVPPEIADVMTRGQAVRFTPGSTSDQWGVARVTSISAEVDRSAGLVVIEAEVGAVGSLRSGRQVTVFADVAPAGTRQDTETHR